MVFMKIFLNSKIGNFPYSTLNLTKVVIARLTFEKVNFLKSWER